MRFSVQREGAAHQESSWLIYDEQHNRKLRIANYHNEPFYLDELTDLLNGQKLTIIEDNGDE